VPFKVKLPLSCYEVQRGSGGVAPYIFILGIRWRQVVRLVPWLIDRWEDGSWCLLNKSLCGACCDWMLCGREKSLASAGMLNPSVSPYPNQCND